MMINTVSGPTPQTAIMFPACAYYDRRSYAICRANRHQHAALHAMRGAATAVTRS